VALATSAKRGATSARCRTSRLPAGTHSIGATYSGDAANNGSSATLTQIVNP